MWLALFLAKYVCGKQASEEVSFKVIQSRSIIFLDEVQQVVWLARVARGGIWRVGERVIGGAAETGAWWRG